MVKRHAILHIGTGKTGTTAIQRVLAANRDQLITQGFAYPTSPGPVNHRRIADFMTGAGNRSRYVAARAGSIDGFVAELRAEIDALPANVRTVVFSNEHTYKAGGVAGNPAKLKAMLDSHFDSYTVLVYLRRQDELSVSRLSTRRKAGNARAELLPGTDTGRKSFGSFDYWTYLTPWMEAFGEDALKPRIFARGDLLKGDVVADFLAACGIGELPAAENVIKNTSILPEAQEFLRQLSIAANAAGKADPVGDLDEEEEDEDEEEEAGARGVKRGSWRPPRMSVRAVVAGAFPGTGQVPARADAIEFFRQFDESNERIRARYFPERKTLFVEDFSKYPEELHEPTGADLLRVAYATVLAQSEIIAELGASAAIANGQKALAEGDRDEALRLGERAHSLHPGDIKPFRFMLGIAESEEELAKIRQMVTASSLGEAERGKLEKRLGASADPARSERRKERNKDKEKGDGKRDRKAAMAGLSNDERRALRVKERQGRQGG